MMAAGVVRDFVFKSFGWTFRGALRTLLSLYVYPIVKISLVKTSGFRGAAEKFHMQTKLVWQPGVAWTLGGPHLRQTPRHLDTLRATTNHLTWATKATVPLLVQRSIQPPVRDNRPPHTKTPRETAFFLNTPSTSNPSHRPIYFIA